MQISATHKYLRIAPRKVRLVAELVQRKKIAEARAILRYTQKGAAEPIGKALQSAVASATNSLQLQEANLYILKVIVNEGPKLKRYRPRARGRAYPIQKKTSHLTVVLDEITPSTQEAGSKKVEMPVTAAGGMNKEKQTSRQTRGKQPKFRPEKDTMKRKEEGGVTRLFRRKAV